jgi:hypothetical protein
MAIEISIFPAQGINYSRLHQELQTTLPGVYLYLFGPAPVTLLQAGQPITYVSATPGTSGTIGLIDAATQANIDTANATVAAHNPATLSTAQGNHNNAVTQRAALRATFTADYNRLNTPLVSPTNAQLIADYNATRTFLAKLLVALNDILLT